MATQFTRLLSNRDLDRLARLRLNAARRFTNRARGEHLAAKGGASTEFCDYRDYSPGDDVRFVDWNIFARIERPYLKQFHQEEELHVAVLVDASNSMLFEGKFDLACQVGAALGVVGLRGSEKVSAAVLGAAAVPRLPPIRGRSRAQKLFAFLEGIQPGGEEPIDRAIEKFLRRHAGRGVAIVISDFLTDGDLRRAFNLLHSAGLEIFGLQVLGPSEISPVIEGDLRLIDCETADRLDITSARDLFDLYHEYRESFSSQLSGMIKQRSGRFLSVGSDETFESIVFGSMRRKGWLQ